MSLYEKVPASVNFVEREKQTEKFWHDNDIFRKSMEQRKGDKTYTSMTVRLRLTVSPTSVTFLPELSRI